MVSVLGSGPHTPTQFFGEQPPPPGVSSVHCLLLSLELPCNVNRQTERQKDRQTDWQIDRLHTDEKVVHMEAGPFTYKSIRIQVDLHISRSFRRHDLGRFTYIEVDSPTLKKRSHKHSNRIAIGQRNKLNLNPAICACCYYVSCVIFVWHSERVDSA